MSEEEKRRDRLAGSLANAFLHSDAASDALREAIRGR
jgi:hypothetical protein